MPPNLLSGSPPFSPVPSPPLKFTQFSSSPNFKFTHPWLQYKKPNYTFTCLSTARPRRKTGSKTQYNTEAAGLVRVLMRNFSDKWPLTTTLDKYVKFVRTEHCFLLFEELGKSDKWLQCLEVCQFHHPFYFLLFLEKLLFIFGFWVLLIT